MDDDDDAHPQPPSLPAASMDADAAETGSSGCTNPWITVLRKRCKETADNRTKPPAGVRPNSPPARPTTKPAVREPPVRLPPNNFTIVYRPREGLHVATLTTQTLTSALATKCGLSLPDFFKQVTILLQPTPNVMVASTADPELAITLSEIENLQYANRQLEFCTYMKPPPGTSRGVVHGLDPAITSTNLMEYLQSNGPTLLHARFMGHTSSALLTFQTKYVPFYVKVGSVMHRCRPFRRTVPVCRACGDVGHRTDVCPTPEHSKCVDCGLADPPTDHSCAPKCQLCSLPHATASKDCPRRYLPQPPTRKTNTHTSRQVSWSAVAARSPAAQPYTTTTKPTDHFPPLPSTTPLQPSQLTQPHKPPDLNEMMSTFQEQISKLLSRVEALEFERTQPPPSPLLPPLPKEITNAQIEAIVDARLNTIIDCRFQTVLIPQVEKHQEQLTANLTTSITGAMDLLRSLNERIGHIESIMQSDNPPLIKKQRTQDGQ